MKNSINDVSPFYLNAISNTSRELEKSLNLPRKVLVSSDRLEQCIALKLNQIPILEVLYTP